MSTATSDAPGAAAQEKKGLSKLLSRMRTLLRRDRGSTRRSTQTALTGPSTAVGTEVAAIPVR
jgi:hypothetical protein